MSINVIKSSFNLFGTFINLSNETALKAVCIINKKNMSKFQIINQLKLQDTLFQCLCSLQTNNCTKLQALQRLPISRFLKSFFVIQRIMVTHLGALLFFVALLQNANGSKYLLIELQQMEVGDREGIALGRKLDNSSIP